MNLAGFTIAVSSHLTGDSVPLSHREAGASRARRGVDLLVSAAASDAPQRLRLLGRFLKVVPCQRLEFRKDAPALKRFLAQAGYL